MDASDRKREAKEKVQALEEDPPKRLEDWPDDDAKNETVGGPEGEAGYEEGPTCKLGPSGVVHHEDGSVTIDGERVDNPDDYKGDPIPGGPTDPNTARIEGEWARPAQRPRRDAPPPGRRVATCLPRGSYRPALS